MYAVLVESACRLNWFAAKMFWFILIMISVIKANGIINEPQRSRAEGRPESDYILPNNIQPLKYELLIIPYFQEPITEPYFVGTLNMTFRAVIPGTSYITLNIGEGLVINESSIRIVSNYGEELLISNLLVDRQTQIFSIRLQNELVPTTDYKMSISFNGLITDAGYGLYRGSYIEPDGIQRYYLGTQLRPVSARQLLPCLDEPKYKANFVLTVEHPNDFIARSNMPMFMMSQPGLDGRRTTTFQETPLMSAYLLTLYVFQFLSYDSYTSSPYIHAMFKGWAVPSKIDQMEWSQQICPVLVDITERYLASPLPVPKMDQVALPQHVVIAMENWGINTYRESNVLADQFSPLRQRQTVARFTAHEILHHWIGDLVTLDWWDYLWIQEAFAMYFEYFLPDQMTPSWRMMDQFVTDLTVEGLHGDNFNSPLTTHVILPKDITNKFMGLTYTKGPAIIRMLESVVGMTNFQSALINLVESTKYSTFNPQVLWAFFNLHTKVNVNEMMSTWTNQGGFPILFVTRDVTTSTIFIDQNSSDDYAGARTGQLWQIPISYTTKTEGNFNKPPLFIMKEPSLKFKQTTLLTSNDWIILNLQFRGYYRILYENEIMHLIMQQLQENHYEIHHLNRAQLIDDVFDFAEKKIVLFEFAFQLVSYIHKERAYVPLRVAFRAFKQIDARLQFLPIYYKFTNVMKLFLSDVYNAIGFDEKLNEQPLDKLNREQIVEWACYYDVEDCRVRSAVLLEKTIREGKRMISLPADIRSTVMCYAVKYGSSESQNYLIDEIRRKKLGSATDEINALACSPQHNLLDILNKHIPQEKWVGMFTAILDREENSLIAAMYLMRNLDKIFNRFGEQVTVSFIKQLQMKTSLQGISSDLANDVHNAFAKDVQSIQDALSDLFGSINRNGMWIEERVGDIERSLDETTRTLQITKYFTNQPYNFYDSFHFTKFIHSHLYNSTEL